MRRNSDNNTALAYVVVFVILILFVAVLVTCYIKQIKSEKFYTFRLELLNEPLPPVIADSPTALSSNLDQSKFMPSSLRNPF